MSFFFNSSKNFLCIFFALISLNPLPDISEASSIDGKYNFNLISSNAISGDDYILGAGDKLQINFYGLNIFNGTHTINAEGNIYLPEIEEISVKGQTLKELDEFLTKKYEESILNPDISIRILKYRPAKFFISGEVKRPGLYTISYGGETSTNKINNLMPTNQITSSESAFELVPRIFDAIKISEGITNYADLSKIKIVRKNTKTLGGGKIQTTINLLKLLKEGDHSQNIRIFDGDSIVIPRSKKIIKDQILSINQTNLTPDIISVYLSGNVTKPGLLELKQGSSLIQAIYAAGGEKYFTGDIKHIRFNKNGKTEKSTFKYKANAAAGTNKNPILLEGDIVHVNTTLQGKTFRAIQEYSVPIFSGYGIYKIFSEE